MWISRDKFEMMEHEIKRLSRSVDMLNDHLSSLERINAYAKDEPTFRVLKSLRTNEEKELKEKGISIHVGYLPWGYQIYLYINKQEYIIEASEIENDWIIDYDRSSLKIIDGFAYIDIFVKGHLNGFEVYRIYHYISKYTDGTKMYGVEELDKMPEKKDILKRDTVEKLSEDPYRFHDLIADPTDLPEKYGEDWVLVKVECTGMDGKPIVAEYCGDGSWHRDSSNLTYYYSKNVLGWFKICDPCLNEKED